MASQFVDGGLEKTEQLFEDMKNWGPTIVWIDEFDSLAQASDVTGGNHHSQQRINALKRNLDGMNDFSHIYLFVGTNYPEKIEEALLSRFQERLEIRLPDFTARQKIIEIISEANEIEITKDIIEEFALMTDNFSGRDLKSILTIAKSQVITRELGKETLKPEKRKVEVDDIIIAIKQHQTEKN